MVMERLEVSCRMCKVVKTLLVDSRMYRAWQLGLLIQRAFPEMSVEDRELLISGTCDVCWEKLFVE